MANSNHPCVTLQADAVAVQWSNGEAMTLPNLWLRDNCNCNECRYFQSGEKKFIVASVAADLQPSDVTLVADELRVTWPDGHLSCYATADIVASDSVVVSSWTPWASKFQPRKTDYQSFLYEDSIAAGAIADFLQFGVCIIDNAPVLPGTLEALVPRLGPVREVLFERIHNVEVYADGYNVAHTPLEIPPHNDFASYTWPPTLQALHMLANDVPGGESVVVDGWDLLQQYRQSHPDWFAVLCTMPVPFRQFDENTETRAVAPLVRCDADGEIVALRFSNQLMQVLNPNLPDVGLFYHAYHELCRRVIEPAAKTTFRLQAGEILLLAAHRVLHGRNAFEATARRHLQDAYYELDNVKNHLFVLQQKSRGAA